MKSIKNWLIKKLGGYTNADISYLSVKIPCEYNDEIGYYKWEIGDKLGEQIIENHAALLVQTYPGLEGIIKIIKPSN